MRDGIYNLGHESLNLTKGELARRIRERTGCQLEVSEDGHDPDRRDYTVDFSKLRGLGFEPELSIDDGIDEMARGMSVIDLRNPYANPSYY
jgi:nucleoside-diphosphate-sugar epimerase